MHRASLNMASNVIEPSLTFSSSPDLIDVDSRPDMKASPIASLRQTSAITD